MREYLIEFHMIEQCIHDPDRVESTQGVSGGAGGLRLIRDFGAGRLTAVVKQDGNAIIVLTAFWRASDTPSKHQRKSRR